EGDVLVIFRQDSQREGRLRPEPGGFHQPLVATKIGMARDVPAFLCPPFLGLRPGGPHEFIERGAIHSMIVHRAQKTLAIVHRISSPENSAPRLCHKAEVWRHRQVASGGMTSNLKSAERM